MKAITIHPVWAWAIVHGHKLVENRTWRTKHRGPLLIHASADSPASRASDARAREELARLGVEVPETVPRGAVVGLVDLIDVIEQSAVAADPLACGPLCWILSNPRPLPRPIPCKGRQQLWECSCLS